jgi:hypothetical protein
MKWRSVSSFHPGSSFVKAGKRADPAATIAGIPRAVAALTGANAATRGQGGSLNRGIDALASIWFCYV